LFPERLPNNIDREVWIPFVINVRKRNEFYLQPLAAQGYFTQTDAEELNDLTIILFLFYLNEVRGGFVDQEKARERCDSHAHRMVDLYIERHKRENQ
jgi:hypothetical protein